MLLLYVYINSGEFTPSFLFHYVITIGKVLKTTSRQVPDYAIVPIDGYPVDRTVHHIATNGWLVGYLYEVPAANFLQGKSLVLVNNA